MKCPYCKITNELTWKRYLKSPLGQHTCASCFGRFKIKHSVFYYLLLILLAIFIFMCFPFILGFASFVSCEDGCGLSGLLALILLIPLDKQFEAVWGRTQMINGVCSVPVTFIPSRVEGLEGVTSVTVYPNRIVFDLNEGSHEIVFFDVAQWPKYHWFWRFVTKNFEWFPRWAVVGERDWGYFRLYTNPVVIIYYDENHENLGYMETLLFRIHDVIRSGGFNTYDAG